MMVSWLMVTKSLGKTSIMGKGILWIAILFTLGWVAWMSWQWLRNRNNRDPFE